MYKRMEDDMDVNCGTILDGGETVQQCGQRVVDLMLETASGQPTKSESFDFGDAEFARRGWLGLRCSNPAQRSRFSRHCERSETIQRRKTGLLPPTRKNASADSKRAIARKASDGGSSLTLLAMTPVVRRMG